MAAVFPANPCRAFPFILSLALLACSAAADPAPPGTQPTAAAPSPTETEKKTPPDDPGEAPVSSPDDPKPAPPKEIAALTLSGRFSNVDVTYDRAGQFIVLDMKGDASSLKSSDKNVSPSSVQLAKSTAYTLLFPDQSGCDTPPELTIANGKVHIALQRAGKPDGTISGCHFLSEFIRASSGGGLKATIDNVPIAGGGKIKQLSIELEGPPQ